MDSTLISLFPWFCGLVVGIISFKRNFGGVEFGTRSNGACQVAESHTPAFIPAVNINGALMLGALDINGCAYGFPE